MQVKVYKVEMYDITRDEKRLSGRMATEGGAKQMGGSIMPETVTLIETEDLEPGEQWTARDFEPRNG